MSKEFNFSFADRELSWLAFNHRVLQEAASKNVPLLERLRFLAIFSSNLDEFFSVRVAGLRSLLDLKKKTVEKLDFNPKKLIKQINKRVTGDQEEFGRIFRNELLPALKNEGINLITDDAVTEEQRGFCLSYFEKEIAPDLQPLILNDEVDIPFLQNKGIYMVSELKKKGSKKSDLPLYGLAKLPSPPLPRFVTLPDVDGKHFVMFIDDVMRIGLMSAYPGHKVKGSYAIKLTRDADLYLDDEFSGSLVEKIKASLGNRETGLPSRFLYDLTMPQDMIAYLMAHFRLESDDVIEGGRYHNLKDLFGFPTFGRSDLEHEPLPPLPHPELEKSDSVISLVAQKDCMLHFPYQSYDPVIRFLNEAAKDPDVSAVYATLYRVSSRSEVTKALMLAAENGKKATAFVEVKARFDEESNIAWAEQMEEAGVNVLYSIPGIKVHCKLALVDRHEHGALKRYSYLATGNFNEKSARIYGDYGLLTSDARITDDVREVFAYLMKETETPSFKYLLVAPWELRKKFNKLIDREIRSAEEGQPAEMFLKMNSLQDEKMIRRLYKSSNAGVDIRIINRGICCLEPGVKKQSEHIEVISIVDRFLEHARAFYFKNGGRDRLYLASADWMSRNLNRRVEVAFPILDPDLKQEILDLLDLQWRDRQKARVIDKGMTNTYKKVENGDERNIRSQTATYDYLKARLSNHEPVA